MIPSDSFDKFTWLSANSGLESKRLATTVIGAGLETRLAGQDSSLRTA
jgi:hypothetical protein